MKKILVLLLIFASLGLFGQTSYLGIKAGPNFSTIGGDGSENFDGRTGFHVGLQIELPVADKFSIQPEVLFSSVGAKGEFDGSNFEQRLNYLQLYVMAKLYLGDNLSFELGPQVATMVSAVQSTESRNDSQIEEFYKNFDVGLNFGFGYKFSSGINFAVRYSTGLANINDVDNSTDKITNQVFQLSIGYFFKS